MRVQDGADLGIWAVPVHAPFRHEVVHAVKPPGIVGFGFDDQIHLWSVRPINITTHFRTRLVTGEGLGAMIKAVVIAIQSIPEGEPGLRPRATGVFPFGFVREPVGTAIRPG